MLSRGYDGRLPVLLRAEATGGQWLAVATLPLAAIMVVVAAWLTV